MSLSRPLLRAGRGGVARRRPAATGARGGAGKFPRLRAATTGGLMTGRSSSIVPTFRVVWK